MTCMRRWPFPNHSSLDPKVVTLNRLHFFLLCVKMLIIIFVVYFVTCIQLVHRHATSDWIISMVTADVDKDGTREVIIGCMDKTATALKFLSV